jgi:thiamine-monophosphate kinase
MGELERIRWIRRLAEGSRAGRGERRGPGSFPLRIGDDAALWTPSRGMSAVLTVDVQVEGIHFRRGWLEPRDIGWRAVASSASDLAAMAARPACVLVSLTLDGGSTRGEFQGIERGILAAARAHGLRLIGGNLSAGPLAISVTAVGEARATEALTRAGARPGDEIWVTGEPGLARLGLLALERGPRGPRPKGISRALQAFRRPRARIQEALEIAGRWRPGAMIDLSDGLALDLRRVLEESSRKRRHALGALLEEEALASPTVARLARALGEPPAATALRGGEDYELLFTARPARRDKLVEAFRRRFGLRIASIGHIRRGGGLTLRARDGTTRPITEKGWEHWGG